MSCKLHYSSCSLDEKKSPGSETEGHKDNEEKEQGEGIREEYVDLKLLNKLHFDLSEDCEKKIKVLGGQYTFVIPIFRIFLESFF